MLVILDHEIFPGRISSTKQNQTLIASEQNTGGVQGRNSWVMETKLFILRCHEDMWDVLRI